MNSQLEYPLKMYPSKSGKLLTSEEMALLQAYGIKKISEQLKATTNPRKIKLLRNRLREIKLWLLAHPDVRQFIK
jgi:hypothetical protein